LLALVRHNNDAFNSNWKMFEQIYKLSQKTLN